MRRPPPPAATAPADAASVSDGRLFSPSFERNIVPLRAGLARHLSARRGAALEIGSGSGQHAVEFARSFPALRWTPSDPLPEHLASIAAWRKLSGLANLAAPLAIDAASDWSAAPAVRALRPLTLVCAVNIIHITPWAVTKGIVAGAARSLDAQGLLVFYGPFLEGGRHTGEGNARFDASLRARDPAWGLRDLEEVEALALRASLGPGDVAAMPANNRLVVFGKK